MNSHDTLEYALGSKIPRRSSTYYLALLNWHAHTLNISKSCTRPNKENWSHHIPPSDRLFGLTVGSGVQVPRSQKILQLAYCACSYHTLQSESPGEFGDTAAS